MSKSIPSQIRILKIKLVAEMTGLSATHIRRLVDRREFPAPVELSAGRVGWVESEIQGWIGSRITARDAKLTGGAAHA